MKNDRPVHKPVPASWETLLFRLESVRGAKGFQKIREEETIAWAGLSGVTSTDQRQNNRLKRQRCGEGTDGLVQGQRGNERQDEGCIFEHQ